jgi:hypothetical protein
MKAYELKMSACVDSADYYKQLSTLQGKEIRDLERDLTTALLALQSLYDAQLPPFATEICREAIDQIQSLVISDKEGEE